MGASCSKYIIEKGIIPIKEDMGIKRILSLSFFTISLVNKIIKAAE